MSLGTGTNYIPSSTGFQSPIGQNSSITALGAGETFTGQWELNTARDVKVDCETDVGSQLYFDFSNDGVNAITDPSLGFSLGNSVTERQVKSKGPVYFRVRLVNGLSAQSYLRLYTYYGEFTELHPASNQRIGRDFSANVTRPSIAQDEIIRGLRSGVDYVSKFAYRENTSQSAGDQTLWADNSNLVIMTTASAFDVTYTSSTDGADGSATGAISILVDYLDENFELQQGVHTLGSSGSDTTSFSGLGINRAAVISTGTANENVNDILFVNAGGSDTQAYIPAGDSVTQQLVYHCPINVDPVMKYLRITTNKVSGSDANVLFKLRTFNRAVSTHYTVRRYNIDTSSTNEVVEVNDISFSGRDVIYITMDTDTNNTIAQGVFSINQYAVD